MEMDKYVVRVNGVDVIVDGVDARDALWHFAALVLDEVYRPCGLKELKGPVEEHISAVNDILYIRHNFDNRFPLYQISQIRDLECYIMRELDI